MLEAGLEAELLGAGEREEEEEEGTEQDGARAGAGVAAGDETCTSSPPAAEGRGRARAFVTLLLASLLSCGAHVCYKMTSSIEEELLVSLSINNEQYGELNSAVSWASLAGVPFAAGVLVDRFQTRHAAVFFCAIVVFGHWIFAYGVDRKNYEIAMLGRAVFGIGESTVLVAQVRLSA